MDNNLLSMKEAGELLGVQSWRVRVLINERKLAAVIISPRIAKIQRAEVERFIKDNMSTEEVLVPQID